jgi:hypothetical protein
MKWRLAERWKEGLEGGQYYEVHLTTAGSKCTIRRFVPLHTCSGAGTPEPARVTTMEPALLSSGRWRRELRLDTHIVLRCPPIMDTGTIRTAVRAPCTRRLAV